VVIVGGGVIGCAAAFHLAGRGARVIVLERTHLAAGPSGVAAGLLAPQVEAPFADAFFELGLLGRAEHAPLAEQLLEEAGLDVEYRPTGILRVARDEAERAELQRLMRWQTARELRVEWLEPRELGQREPLLRGVAGQMLGGGIWLPDEAQVRTPRLVQALAIAAVRRGAQIHEATPALAIDVDGSRVRSVTTPQRRIGTDTVVLAAGIWTSELARQIGLDVPVAPVKGQLLNVRALGAMPRQVLWAGDCYLAPKADGQIILGATEEDGNYDARPTLGGIGALIEAALELAPAIGSFTIDGLQAGLRPAAPDRRPIVGWAPGIDGLMLATAHFRNGVLLGPLTGRVVADQIVGGREPIEFAPFGPARFAAFPLCSEA
jgi:glycine oxidase